MAMSKGDTIISMTGTEYTITKVSKEGTKAIAKPRHLDGDAKPREFLRRHLDKQADRPVYKERSTF